MKFRKKIMKKRLKNPPENHFVFGPKFFFFHSMFALWLTLFFLIIFLKFLLSFLYASLYFLIKFLTSAHRSCIILLVIIKEAKL